jgi:3-dehydroquinate dehydratase-1
LRANEIMGARKNSGHRQLAIGRVRLGAVPRVVLCVSDTRGGQLPAGCCPDLVEARIDLFRRRTPADVERTLRSLRRAGRPLIATVRTAAEGGAWQGSESEREVLFNAALPLVHAVDIELTSRTLRPRVITAAHAAGRSVIVSSHDFHRTPTATTLAGRIQTARRAGADIVKLSTHARSPADVATLMSTLLRHRAVPLVILAMGPVGMMSRVFFGVAGSLLTYAFADDDAPTAPGQMTLRTLQAELARYYPAYRTPRR